MRRPLVLEPLEPRVYLSAGAGDDPAAARLAADQVHALVNELFPSGLASTAEVQAFDTADSRTRVLLVDVNGNADDSPALLAAFDRDTGKLLASIELAAGQFALVTNLSAGNDGSTSPHDTALGGLPQLSFNLAIVSRQDSASVSPADVNSSGADYLDSSRRPPSGQVTAATRNDTFTTTSVTNDSEADRNAVSTSANSNAATDSTPTSPPVVVVIPTGAQSETLVPGGNRDTARPLILAPIFSQWFAVLNTTPWWGRAVELPGVQSRVGDLLDRGLDDDYFSSRSRLGMADEFGDSLNSLEFATSRVMLRSPAQLMVFAAPATHAPGSGGAGAELATYNFATGQLARTGHAVSSRLFAAGDQVAFLSSEIEQGADLSGDGAMNALVLQVFNPVTGGVRNTGVSADRIRAEAGQLILGLRDVGKEATASSVLASTGKLWAYRFDPSTGRLTNLLRPFDVGVDTAAAPSRAEAHSVFEPPMADAAIIVRANRPIDPSRSADLMQGQTIAPIDTPASRPIPVAIDASPRPAGGNPAGPPKPGGSAGTSAPDSNSSASSPSSASAPAGSSSGDGGSGAD
jgi:hypothetical protein